MQVIFSILIGIWLGTYLYFTLRVPLSSHVRLMLEFNQTEMTLPEKIMHKLKAIKYAVGSFGLLIFMLVAMHAGLIYVSNRNDV